MATARPNTARPIDHQRGARTRADVCRRIGTSLGTVAERKDHPRGRQAASLLNRVQNQFIEKPAMTWGVTVALIAVIFTLAFVLIGARPEPDDVALNCTVHERNGTLRLTISGKVTQKDADSGCAGVAARLSGQEIFWVVGKPPMSKVGSQVICAPKSPDANLKIVIEDVPSGFAGRGETICSTLMHAGWNQAANLATLGNGLGKYNVARTAKEARQHKAEIREQRYREREAAGQQKLGRTINRCVERAEAQEQTAFQRIERETEKRVRSEANRNDAAAREHEAQERAYAAEEACERKAGFRAGETEYP